MTVIKFTEATSDYFQGTSSTSPTTEEKFQDLIINNNTVNKAVIDTSLWQPSTNYVVGDTRKSPSMTAGMFAICTVLGTSGTSEPTWSTTTGTTVTDNGVTWVMAKAISSNGGDITGNLTISGNSIALLAYPIGAVYISMVSTSPATLFGGTWVVIKDKFLLSAGDTYANGATGGEATHALTISELPRHSFNGTTNVAGNHDHTFSINGYGVGYPTPGSGDFAVEKNIVGEPGYTLTNLSGSSSTAENHSHTFSTNSIGGNEAHNNMPPYLVVYMWRRIS